MPEFTNPSQQGSSFGSPSGGQDNRSLLTMMFVMVAVFFGLQFYRTRHNPQTASPNQPTQNQQATPQNPQTAAGIAPPSAASLAGASLEPTVAAPAEASTVVENELYRISFSNKGAQVTSWILKRQKDADGRPLDLVHQQAARQFGYPLSLYTYDPALTAGLADALYVPSTTGQVSAPATLSFQFSAAGLDVKKTFSFDETYVLHADVQVTRNGAPIQALLSWPGGFGDQENAQLYASSQLDSSTSGKEQHVAPKKVPGGATLPGPFDWAGVSDTYFAAIFLPENPATSTLVGLHHELDVAKTIRRTGLGSGSPAKGAINVPILGAALGDTTGHTRARLFVGPKAVEILKNIHAADPSVTLQPLLDFGFFGPIGRYLFLSLQWIHAHIVSGWSGSWGWAIVLLTILINVVLLPLRVKTMQSGLKMQRLQPQTDAIKARYKDLKVTDPKRNEMNAEIMQLQKENGVNMFGGCIPTLIQLPLLFAFFGMLPKVVELRHAHWGWLPDLTAADPYHILPILMVVSQFLVQYYTPSPGVDPQQQKMMAFMMPAVSGYMTWNYASGLALYWSVGNLIGIAQQAVMNRTSLGREMREIAAKRNRTKASRTAPTIQGRR